MSELRHIQYGACGSDLQMTAAPRSPLRILVADDHRLMLAAVRRALERSDAVRIVAEVDDATKILPAIGESCPDVLLLDIRMPRLDGLTCLERVRSRYPGLPVVVLSTFAGEEQIEAARERGASGYIVKTVDPLQLPQMIEQAVQSPEFLLFHAEAPQPQATGDESPAISARELAILRAVAGGQTNRAIASELWVSEQTVKFHLRNVYRKLGLTNRTEAARYAISHGLVARAGAASGT
jgi:DNA-binding NarL/FixJ family response regulator